MNLIDFNKKIEAIYGANKIKVLSWKTKSSPLMYYCSNCNEQHTVSRATNLFWMHDYCTSACKSKTNQKVGKDFYINRINKIHNNQISVLEYNGLSNKAKLQCNRCGNIVEIVARVGLTKDCYCEICCNSKKKGSSEILQDYFNKYQQYELISWSGSTNEKIKMRCKKCGTIFERWYSNIKTCPDTCPSCNSRATKQKLTNEEVQQRLDEQFGANVYTILDYQGQLNKRSKIRCNKCGFIFNAQLSYFITQTRGCPKCMRFKSKGERATQQFFEENDIRYEAQKRFKDCNNNLSSFDFAAYDKKGTLYLIEINGIQHYKQTTRFGDLQIIQKRDQIKIDYCKNKNIPLIIIPYYELDNIPNILSFLKGSTTTQE